MEAATARISSPQADGILWKACDTLRGAVDPSEYKSSTLVMLVSDVWQDHYDTFVQKYGDRHEESLGRCRKKSRIFSERSHNRT